MFSQRVKDFIALHGNIQNAKKYVLKDYKMKNRKTEMFESYNSILQPSKIYTFDYDPKYKDIAYYDTQPLVLCLGATKSTDGSILEHGINLNYLTFELKMKLFDDIHKVFGNMLNDRIRQDKENPFRLDSDFAIKSLGKDNAQFCYRTYIPNRRSGTISFSYKYWVELMVLDISDFHNITLGKLTRLYMMQKIKNDNG